MDNFRKPFESYYKRCYSNSGSGVRDKMSVVISADGGKHLAKVGKEDFYSFIQSHRDSVDLQKILQRCMITGDVSALQQRQGAFIDATVYPTDNRQYHNILMNAEKIYDNLVSDLKKDLSFDAFLETFSDPTALRKLIESRKTENKEVINNES